MGKNTYIGTFHKEDISDICYLIEALYYVGLDVVPQKYDYNSNDSEFTDIRYHSHSSDVDEPSIIEAIYKPITDFKTNISSILLAKTGLENPFLSDDYKVIREYVNPYFMDDIHNRDKHTFLNNLQGTLGVSNDLLNSKRKCFLNHLWTL